jgi:exonuclease III
MSQRNKSKTTLEEHLSITTLNVENFRTNLLYINSLVKKCSIVCIQEHWLYNFEVPVITEGLDNICAAVKCVDDEDPISPLQRPRGKGGVAIIWKKDIDHLVTALEDGGDRIQCIIINANGTKLCIACTYMPCRGKHYDTDYSAVLDEVFEIKKKHQDCHFVWAGDMNASYIRSKNYVQDSMLMNFCEEVGVERPTGMKPTSTFQHHNKKDQSQIDYILIPRCLQGAVSSVHIHEDPLNTSPHSPVTINLSLMLTPMTPNPQTPIRNMVEKPNWKKLNKRKYLDELACRLEALDVITDKHTPVEVEISRLYSILTSSALEAAPAITTGQKGKKKLWSPQLIMLAKENKAAHRRWTSEGKLGHGSATHRLMKLAKAKFRRAQRTLTSEKRKKQQDDILLANSTDQILFHQLIRNQRGTPNIFTDTLEVEGVVLEGANITNGWATYFHNLSTPIVNSEFDDQYKNDVDLRVLLLHDINKQHGESLPSFTTEDVRVAVARLKSGKSADELGLQAEHLKHGGDIVLTAITKIINNLNSSGKVPELFKTGLVTPVYKKNKKPIDQPNSYRRITITSILGKVVERLLEPLVNSKLDAHQSRLQSGFTKGVSCMNAALLLSEAINESADSKTAVWMAMFDAAKAFDVVWQNSLLLKLHNIGIDGQLWLLLEEWYRGQKSAVKWRGDISETFNEQQGVRQGGILSPVLYKAFVNPLLVDLQDHSVGYHIGSTFVGIPTCADDVTVIASKPEDLQSMINVAENYANSERYQFNTTKTNVQHRPGTRRQQKTTLSQDSDFNLYNKPLAVVDTQTHLGIDRHADQRDGAVVPGRIQCGRRTAYSLMGAGLHGLNGLGAACCCSMWNTFVIPRLLHGLEVLHLTKKDIQSLEAYQMTVMKQIQHLPQRTSNAITLLLLGQQPIEAAIDKRMLLVFGDAVRRDSVERDVVMRQLAMKTSTSNSWVTAVRLVLQKYSLPSHHQLVESPPSKLSWKRMVKNSVASYWTRELLRKARLQSTLKYINLENCKIGTIHQVWDTVTDARDATRASAKVKLLTGSYTLQANKAVFNQFQVNKTCLLCDDGPEDRKHFLVDCIKLRDVRNNYISELQSLLAAQNPTEWRRIISCSELTLQLILDCSSKKTAALIPDGPTYTARVECITRRLCYALLTRRSAVLAEI